MIHLNRGNRSEKTVQYVGRRGIGNRGSVACEIKCIWCNNVYVGEKSRSTYSRGKEHSESLGNKEEHNSEIQQFQMNVTGVYSNDAMLRQISEGIKINNVDED